jgi:hypothetical protein
MEGGQAFWHHNQSRVFRVYRKQDVLECVSTEQLHSAVSAYKRFTMVGPCMLLFAHHQGQGFGRPGTAPGEVYVSASPDARGCGEKEVPIQQFLCRDTCCKKGLRWMPSRTLQVYVPQLPFANFDLLADV